MNSKQELLDKINSLKQVLSEKYFVSKMGLFGSFFDGTFQNDSDIDLLVEYSKPNGWKAISLELFLQKELNRKVDLVTENALKPQIKNQILRNIEYLIQ